MTLGFDGEAGLIVVPTKPYGPSGDVVVRLALDTGATATMINWDLLILVGYDPAIMASRIQVTTGSGVEFVPQIEIEKIEALAQARQHFQVLCHTLPPSATVDGVLGLDFLRRCRLTVDFRQGVVDLG